ncbi:MAG: hypothetical protein J5858_07095 [Lentisphaeria bacterium]|nr:hypothetical protein [Lentisphaeria bacterium]
MKKKSTVFILAAVAAGLSAVEPHVDMKVQKLDDGRTTYTRNVYLNDGKMTLIHTTEDGKVTKSTKWGEIRFGLDFGRLPGTNGGWSLWDFFRCYEYNPKPYNLVRERMPTLVSAGSIGGTAVVDMEFPSQEDGKLKIRMMQFPSHPEWIFMRVKSEDFNIWRIDFQAFPYQSDLPKDRERRLSTEKGDVNINKEAVKFSDPTGHYLALYNEFIQDTAGNFLIIQPEKIRMVEVPKCKASVNIRLYARKGIRQFDFALGYFQNQPASDAVNRFFTGNGDAIRKFMDGIDWNPRISTENFDKNFSEAKKLGIAKDKLEAIQKSYRKAVEKKDFAAATKAEKELERLKKTAAASGLSDFM